METKHSAGLAIVYNNMILLGHPTNSSWYGTYSIPKGGIEDGENKIQAAIRETAEEMGIFVDISMIDKTEHTLTLTSKNNKYNKVIYYYIVKINDIADLRLNSIKVPKSQLQLKEMDWGGFLSYTDAIKRISKSQLSIINNLVGLGLLESKILDFDTFNNNI